MLYKTMRVSNLVPFFAFACTVAKPYVVVLKDDVLIGGQEANFENKSPFTDCHVITGGNNYQRMTFCVVDSFPSSSSEVEYIEPNGIYRINAAAPFSSPQYQKNAPWGIARVSYLKEDYGSGKTEFRYYEGDGEGVVVYVIDTGALVGHVDFEKRVTTGLNLVKNEADDDQNGHGTHVMATVLGKQYGIAKKARGVAVKVLNGEGSGTLSDVIRGIGYVIEQHKQAPPGTKSVINMSLGGGKSPTLERAVQMAVEAGVHVVVAAGNENQDACKTSPAASPYAITVGATQKGDSRVWFSNYGPCVDIYAPGHMILSAWNTNRNASNTISGTSMASPHVCGVLAALLSRSYDDEKLMKLAEPNVVKGEKQSFLFNGVDDQMLFIQQEELQ